MAIEPGRICKSGRFWLLFPTRETARYVSPFERRTNAFGRDRVAAAGWAKHWSAKLGRGVVFLTPDDVIMVVKVTSGQIGVVDQSGNVGWINICLYTADQLDSMFKPIAHSG